jgi:arabinofuranosyltransferase
MRLSLHRLVPIALSLAFALLLAVIVSGYWIDDAYISFHYADNLVREGSLYYNKGEQGPFGYTNPLYIFLLAALRFASAGRISFEAISRSLGCLSLAAILTPILWTIADRPDRSWKSTLTYGGFALLFFLLFPDLLANFYSGLETGLFTLSLFVMILSVAPRDPRTEVYFLTALALAVSLRFDGIVLAMPLLGIYCLDALRQSDRRRLLRVGYAFLAAGLVYAFHLALAGFWVPLSLYQKHSSFSIQSLWSYAAFSLLVLAPLLVITYRRTAPYLTGLAIFYPLLVSLFYTFFMHWMFNRYVFPAVFALSASLLLSLFRCTLEIPRREFAFLCLYVLAAFPAGAFEGYSWVSGYRVAMLNTQRVAEAMNAADLPTPYRTVAAQDAGYLAYGTDWRLLDLLGLTTPEVLTEDVAGAVRRLAPTVLIVNAPNESRPEDLKLWSRLGRSPAPIPVDYRLVKHLPFTNRYWWPEVNYGYFIFVNGNANRKLTRGLESISVGVEKEIGWQGYGFRVARTLMGGRLAGAPQ